MSAPTSIELMQYVDDELAPADAERVAQWLESSEAAQASADGLVQIGDFVRAAAEATTPEIDVRKQVMQAVATPAPPASLAEHRRSHRLRAAWPLAAAALAAAAAVALLVTRRPEVPVDVAPKVIGTERGVAATSSEPPTVAVDVEAVAGASVETLDPGPGGATLFVVQEGAISTPVVWLLDDSEESGDRIGPL